MSRPREILPGRMYFISRRCLLRLFLLRPGKDTNAIFTYCLGEAAKRCGILLLAWVTMSNHYHAVVYDPDGRLPAFIEHLHKLLAKALNARWGRTENLWSAEETCVTYLPTYEDVLDKVIYVLANPVASHLVDRLADWPGVSSLHHLDGAATTHERPRSYFRAVGGTMPKEAELRMVLPPIVASRETLETWAANVRTGVAAREELARSERQRTGTRVVGRKALLRASEHDSPSTAETRSKLRPALACKDVERRVVELRKLVQFRTAHESARQKFIGGERNVEFPAGTYRMRKWGACCAPFPVAIAA